jgi:regulator of sirC expression with transglutaminase-like and TPR domain
MSGAPRSNDLARSESDTARQLARLKDLCAGDGVRLEVLEVALTLSLLQHDEPIDLVPFRQHVAQMSAAVADLVHRRGAVPEALAEVIAQSFAYRGDNDTYDDPQNADLVKVIERRKGLPVALALLYLQVARDQGWDAEGLNFPGHFLIRVAIDGARHVVDPFNDGVVRDAADLRELTARVLGPNAQANPAYYDPVADRQVLLRLENNIRLRLVQREDWTGTLKVVERMLAIDPEQPGLMYEAGQINVRLDKRRAAIAAFERFLMTKGAEAHTGIYGDAIALLQELRRELN